MQFKTITVYLPLFAHIICSAVISRAEIIPLSVSNDIKSKPLTLPAQQELAFPGENNFYLKPPKPQDWAASGTLSIKLAWPANAPEYCGSLSWLKDRPQAI